MIRVQVRQPRWVWLHNVWGSIGVWCDDGMLPLFSERYGYVKVWRVVGLVIKYRPNKARPGAGIECP